MEMTKSAGLDYNLDYVLAYLDVSSIRLLSKLHLAVKIAIFGIFIIKFFDHMFTYALKICR